MSPRTPVLLVGHGAPTLAIDPVKGGPLRAWGASLAQPRGVLVVSAHWETATPTLGSTVSRPLVHDYRGFPPELGRVDYPAPGAPALSERVAELLGGADRAPTRGWDHGVWTPLVHLLPGARVPVLQLSLPRGAEGRELLELGRSLAPLRDEGIWILGSGNFTHDLGSLRPDGSPPSPRARDFDAWVAGRLRAGDHRALADAPRIRPDFRFHHPTPEHWNALILPLGATDPEEEVRFPVTGWEYGDLSRRSVEIG